MILDLFCLEGKVALVTGAASGLGQAMALGLAEAGADVALVDRHPPEETAGLIQNLGKHSCAITYDLNGLHATSADKLVAQVKKSLGRMDIVVNNAGIIRRAEIANFSETDWHDVINVNLNACFFLSQASIKYFREQKQGGKIINIASMLSFQGGMFVPSYTAAKSAIAGLTRSLANEVAQEGIHVNAIAPGYMETSVTTDLRRDPQRRQAILERIPADRWGKPQDLQGACVYLASEASNYVHGAIVVVDGGWLGR